LTQAILIDGLRTPAAMPGFLLAGAAWSGDIPLSCSNLRHIGGAIHHHALVTAARPRAAEARFYRGSQNGECARRIFGAGSVSCRLCNRARKSSAADQKVSIPTLPAMNVVYTT
jgi:hypothetical protein